MRVKAAMVVYESDSFLNLRELSDKKEKLIIINKTLANQF